MFFPHPLNHIPLEAMEFPFVMHCNHKMAQSEANTEVVIPECLVQGRYLVLISNMIVVVVVLF